MITVDYDSVDDLTRALEANKVDTVISALNIKGGPSPDFNLIAAAEKATSVKRYVANIWGMIFPEEVVTYFPFAKFKIGFVDTLANTSLEYTSWLNGQFADSLLVPHLKSYSLAIPYGLDIAKNVAAIPGSGNVPFTLTYTFDLAKFVAASLSLPKWETKTYVSNDRLTWNELLAIVEDIKGVKFTVTYDSVEMLKSGKITELPSQIPKYAFMPKEKLQGFLAAIGRMFETGVFDLKSDHPINHEFPDIKTRTMRELLTEAWAGK
ncbi:hypothetical protein ABW20_dc0103516 [Dactylellina cionopaga]|nr:hypothetical protein ABW20_dc0103516 [Dactylellina cionopaga]